MRHQEAGKQSEGQRFIAGGDRKHGKECLKGCAGES